MRDAYESQLREHVAAHQQQFQQHRQMEQQIEQQARVGSDAGNHSTTKKRSMPYHDSVFKSPNKLFSGSLVGNVFSVPKRKIVF